LLANSNAKREWGQLLREARLTVSINDTGCREMKAKPSGSTLLAVVLLMAGGPSLPEFAGSANKMLAAEGAKAKCACKRNPGE